MNSALHRPIVLCGASGVGKGTLIKYMMDKNPNKFGFSVSHTTRAPRTGEVDGVHYHFVTHEKFNELIKNNAFVEYAQVHLNCYGTSFEAVRTVLRAQKCCILDIDIQGARQVKKSDLNPIIIFVHAPSLQILEARLRGRGTETEESIRTRMANGIKEAEIATKNEDNLFDGSIVNDDIPSCYEALKSIVTKCDPTLILN
jgi:guanylate kinase